MRLEHPLWLLALLPAVGAAIYAVYLSEKRGAAMTFPDASSLPRSSRSARALVRWVPGGLAGAAAVLMVLGLARPQSVSRESAGPTEGIDIMMVLDTSLSMRALDFDPLDRMSAAKSAAREFLKGRISDRIGILVFAGAPVLTCPLTLDYEALYEFLDNVDAGMTMTQGTAIGDGIASAVNHLKDGPAKSKVAILLTDGASNVDSVDPFTAAKAAKSFGIKVYAIGTGARGEARIPVDDPVFGRRFQVIPDQLDEDTLLKVAAETDGKYFRATNLRELSSVYAEIDRLEKTKFEQPEIVSYKDHYPWLLVPALLLLLAEMALGATWLMRIP
ncbi:MAG: VWA domain-containing protein [Elusimicrobiota bacterium]